MQRTLVVVVALALVAVGCATGGGGRRRTLPATVGLERLPPVPAGGPGRAGWPMAGRDARHSGSTAALGPLTGRVRWERQLEGNVTPGPAVGPDGTVYAASNAGVLHAIDPADGQDRWTYDGGGAYGSDLSTTPAVLDDGVILWPGPDDALHAVDTGGRLQWRHRLDAFVLSPVVLDDGAVVVSGMDGTVERLDWPGGDHRRPPVVAWSVELGGESYGSPASVDDVVYATAGADLVAIDAGTGAVGWRFSTGDLIEVSPSVAPDGTIVVASNDPYTYGVNPDGTRRWRHRRPAMSFSSPATTDTGLVVEGDHRAGVDVLDAATGDRLGRFQGNGARTRSARSIGVWTAPAVDGAHRVYFGTRHGHIHGFAPDGHQLFDIDVGATVDSYPALTADGALIVGVTDGRLLAIADDTRCTASRRDGDGTRLSYSPNRPDAVVGATVSEPAVGISIDDGPDPIWTPQILDVLARHDAHATFFVLGRSARRHPDLIAAIAAAGHEIAVHGYDHDDIEGMTRAEIAEAVDASDDAIEAAGAEPAALYRPPHGVQNTQGAETICELGLRTIGWWVNVNELTDPVINRVEPGAIVLAHDGRRDRALDVSELDRLLTLLDTRNVHGVTITTLLTQAVTTP
jgi:peptidoglycan/xylan/chitin deacetylase (PgdA/CDA1 family)/outer membrane protein assembly factor BamB